LDGHGKYGFYPFPNAIKNDHHWENKKEGPIPFGKRYFLQNPSKIKNYQKNYFQKRYSKFFAGN
jgi:hypothetical protein